MKRSFFFLLLFGFALSSNFSAAAPICSWSLEKATVSGVRVNGVEVAYTVSGDFDAKTAVIFLPGLERDQSEFQSVENKMLAQKPHLLSVRLDLLGQGATGKRMQVTTEIEFQDQLTLLDHLLATKELAGKKIVLVGHSYGGGIAARYAADRPGVVKDVILVAPFVDHLEIHQPGVGPMMAFTKFWLDFSNLGAFYESAVGMSSEAGSLMTWPAYSMLNGVDANVGHVLAMTRGIRNIKMTEAVSKMDARTRVSFVISQFDELIPGPAHLQLWNAVPPASQGAYYPIWASHNGVQLLPSFVATPVLNILNAD